MSTPRTPNNPAALARLLKDPAWRKILQAHFHRTMLWRYATSRACPDRERAALLEEVTGRRIRARGWPAKAWRLASKGAA